LRLSPFKQDLPVLVFFHGIKLERNCSSSASLPRECGVDRLQGLRSRVPGSADRTVN